MDNLSQIIFQPEFFWYPDKIGKKYNKNSIPNPFQNEMLFVHHTVMKG